MTNLPHHGYMASEAATTHFDNTTPWAELPATLRHPKFAIITMPSEKETTPPHISIENNDQEGHGSPKANGMPRSSSGWDGKLRIEKEKKAELVNPEAISDPEYSDEEQVLAGQTIEADEGMPPSLAISSSCRTASTRAGSASNIS